MTLYKNIGIQDTFPHRRAGLYNYPPPYIPLLNPMEDCFSAVKSVKKFR